MKTPESTFEDEDTDRNPFKLDTPLSNEELISFIGELPDALDYINGYTLLKEFIKKYCPKNIVTNELIMFIKTNILKITMNKNNPIAVYLINQAIVNSILGVGYISATEIMLQLKKLIVRSKRRAKFLSSI
jgi:hypothetical protein